MNMEVYLAYQRAKMKAVSARAEAKLARLGGDASAAAGAGGEPVDRSSNPLTHGLTASQIERDARSMKNILRVWKATGKGGAGSRILLPSGRMYIAPGGDTRGGFEMAVIRPHKYKRRPNR